MASINVINGITIEGDNISIRNNKVYVDGKEYPLPKQTEVKIEVSGNVNEVRNITGDVIIKGAAGSVSTQSGDVDVAKDIDGNVSTMSGDVVAKGKISGNVNTMSGDIIHKI